MTNNYFETIVPSPAGSEQWMAAALSAGGVIEAVSNSAEQLTGYSPDELIDKHLSCILIESAHSSVSEMLQGAREWGIWCGEVLIKDRSGKEWQARTSVTVLAGRGSRPVSFLMVSTSMADSAENPLDLPLSEVSLRLREIAHALNNPLAVIMGFTQLLLLEARCDLKTRADLERIYSELVRISRIVDKFHAFAIALARPAPELEVTRQ